MGIAWDLSIRLVDGDVVQLELIIFLLEDDGLYI